MSNDASAKCVPPVIPLVWRALYAFSLVSCYLYRHTGCRHDGTSLFSLTSTANSSRWSHRALLPRCFFVVA